MTPALRQVQKHIPIWKWGRYWGCGEGIEWTLFLPNPISLMIRSERVFFDCNNYAIRICFLFFSLFVEVNAPWYVKDRMLFFTWYPYKCRSDWSKFQVDVSGPFTFYVKLGTRMYSLRKLIIGFKWHSS